MVEQMLKAFYTCGYDDNAVGDDDAMNFNARMYAFADKLQAPFLKELSKSKLNTLLDSCKDYVKVVRVMHTIYTSTLSSDRGLRDLLSLVLERDAESLRVDEGFLDLLKSGLADGDFAADVFVVMARLIKPKPMYECRDCNYLESENRYLYCRYCEEYIGKVAQQLA